MSLHTCIAGIEMSCIMNASGCLCTTGEELNQLSNSGSGAIVSKSSTINPRDGNSTPRSYFTDQYSINSMGIPNLGYKYYLDWYLNYKKTNKNSIKKPFIQSLYPFSTDELIEMFSHINSTQDINDSYMIELNISCGNVQNTNSFEKINEYLDIIKQINNNNIPIGLKVLPCYHSYEFDNYANLFLKYQEHVKFVNCVNSVVNCLDIDIDTETTKIVPNHGLGGLGGKAILPIGLSNVYQLSNRLSNSSIQLIGTGGIVNGEDVFKYILVGADAVQVGSTLCTKGVEYLDNLNSQVLKIMEQKGYSSIKDFSGKIKYQ